MEDAAHVARQLGGGAGERRRDRLPELRQRFCA